MPVPHTEKHPSWVVSGPESFLTLGLLPCGLLLVSSPKLFQPLLANQFQRLLHISRENSSKNLTQYQLSVLFKFPSLSWSARGRLTFFQVYFGLCLASLRSVIKGFLLNNPMGMVLLWALLWGGAKYQMIRDMECAFLSVCPLIKPQIFNHIDSFQGPKSISSLKLLLNTILGLSFSPFVESKTLR